MTRIVGKIYENTKEIKENNHRGGGAWLKAVPLFSYASLFFCRFGLSLDVSPGIWMLTS